MPSWAKNCRRSRDVLKAVMFDWDGTLYNSVIPTYESYLGVMDAFGLQQVTLEEFRQESRPNYHDYYLYLGIREDDWAIADAAWMDCYVRHNKECVLFDGTADALLELKKMHLKLGLVSGGSRERVTSEVSEQGIEAYFDTMLFGDDVFDVMGEITVLLIRAQPDFVLRDVSTLPDAIKKEVWRG